MKRIPEKLSILLSLLLAATAVVLMMPRTASFGYDYKKGSTWKYETLYAQFDFPILKTQEQIDAETEEAAAVIPYYRYSEETVSRSESAVSALGLGELGDIVSRCLRDIYFRGVVSDEGVKSDERGRDSDVLYIQVGKRAVKRPSSEVYTLTDARLRLVSAVTAMSGRSDIDSLFSAVGAENLISPNLIYDRQTTTLVSSSAVANISPTSGFVKAGQLIVSEGEIVTAEIGQMLDSYRKEYNTSIGYNGPILLLWLGNILLALLIIGILVLITWLVSPQAFSGTGIYYIVMVFLINALMALGIMKIDEDLLYLMPFTLAAAYLRAFFKPSLSVPIYAVSLLPLLIFPHRGTALFVLFLAGGLVTIYGADNLGKGWKQFLLAFVTFLVMAVTYLGFDLVDLVEGRLFRVLCMLLGAAMLSVAGYPLTYLFERMFGFISNARLQELSDTSNPLLRELEQKAPGTFQHSLQVMNMADAAARAIDADPLLVRTGALYHDIGKLANPQCFVENESLLNRQEKDKYHTTLSAVQSASDIIRHVTDGIEIAQKHHLPEVVVDFISSHHGTTLVSYFWNRHLGRGGDPVLEPSFHYPGSRPKTKEQIILMLCDSMEAASRTIGEYTPEAYSAFVEKIVDGKMAEGQFDDADISMNELGKVKAAIKTYLAQMHHGRVSYPEKKIKSIFKKK